MRGKRANIRHELRRRELVKLMKAAQEASSATGDGEEIAALDDPPTFQSFNRMAFRIAHAFGIPLDTYPTTGTHQR